RPPRSLRGTAHRSVSVRSREGVAEPAGPVRRQEVLVAENECRSNRMNINHVSVTTLPVLHRYGGAIERRVIETARDEARRGHRVSVYSVGDTDETRELDGVTYRFVKCRSSLPWKHYEFQYRAVREMRQSRADVVHFHSQPEGALLSGAVRARKVLSYD